MSYIYTFLVPLASTQTELTLKAQLITHLGVNQGGEVTTGFVEIGSGHYLSTLTLPDGFRGAVKWMDDGTDEHLYTTSVNPQDAENLDAKVSAAAGSDPLENEVPGSYASGTAGAALGRIGVGRIQVSSHITPGNDLFLVRGDDYSEAIGSAIIFNDEESESPLPNLEDAEAVLVIQGQEFEGEIVEPTASPKVIQFELTAAETEALDNIESKYAVQIFFPDTDGERRTIVKGKCIIRNETE